MKKSTKNFIIDSIANISVNAFLGCIIAVPMAMIDNKSLSGKMKKSLVFAGSVLIGVTLADKCAPYLHKFIDDCKDVVMSYDRKNKDSV
jgi:hypothetical protein